MAYISHYFMILWGILLTREHKIEFLGLIIFIILGFFVY